MTPENKLVGIIVALVFTWMPNSNCGRVEMPAVCKEFYELSAQQREKEFVAYPVDKQLDIYRCAMKRKPPESGWAYDIAKRGDKKLPTVLEQLNAENDEVMQYHLIRLLRVMSDEPYFSGRQDVAGQIREVVSKMRSSPLKTQAQEALKEIERKAKED